MTAGTDEARLMARYAPLVRHIVGALQAMRPPVLEEADAYQDGMIGLLRAIRSHKGNVTDPAFLGYAGLKIRGAVIDGYRAAGEQSRGDYAQARRIREAVAAGVEVAPAERAWAERFLAEAWLPAVPLDPTLEDGPLLADPQPGPEQRTEANRLLRKAIDALQACALRDRNIFIACELYGSTQHEVAARYDLTPGRVSQIIRAVRQEVLLALA
ncbi:sigma-70 family RNA polymerase sigma factor [Dechloromonas sp. ZS-1]|uniref:sigma-70 family RNA polymerase sigma factor n=1 Tax=Dechloromonas sp. ZS-1 TaxID=3138067 RepID=UPI0031FD1A62